MLYSGSYEVHLVLVSIIVGIITFFACFNLNNHMKTFNVNKNVKWVIGGSLTMGLGVWSVHFIGMLGYNVHAPVTYHVGKSVLSLILAVIGAFIAFYPPFHAKKVRPFSAIFMGSTFMGMHFIGMKSMEMEVSMSINILPILISIIMAILLSGWLVILFSSKEVYQAKNIIINSLIFGLAVAVVHYTAMEAVILKGTPSLEHAHNITFSNQLSQNLLAYILCLAVILIIGIIVSLAYMDKYRAERFQKKTEAHYKSIVEHNPNIVFTVDNHGLVLDVNPKGLEIIKLKREEIISSSFFSFFKDEDQEMIEFKFQDLQEWGKDFEAPFRNGEGQWIPMFISLVPIIIEGKKEGIFVVARDNTELVKSEKRIKKAQRDLFNTIRRQQGMTYKFIKVGDRYIHTLCEGELLYKIGQTPKKVVGKYLDEFTPNDQMQTKLEAYSKAWNGEVAEYEARVNGVDYYVTLRPVLNNGKVVEVIGSGVDISHKKEQELKLKETNALILTLIDSLPMGLIVTDDNSNILALNRPFCRLFDLDESIGDLIGKDFSDYQHSIFLNTKEELPYLHILSEKRPAVDFIELKNHRILKRSYFPFYMDEELKGHLWLFEDITEHKQMERKIINAKEEAEEANLAKSEFLSKMSHELRTPLNGILGFSQLLEMDQTLNSQQQMFVDEILKGGRHLLALVNEILDLARIETGRLKITNETVEIGKVIKECMNLISTQAVNKRIHIDNQMDNSEVYVYVDQIRLRQVFINLLENAIKYNRDNGKIEIVYEYEEGSVTIHIMDNGIGIPLEEQQQIFEPFYRREHPKIDGTGIGLSLVKQLVHLMEGEVGVRSKVGEGSDFWIRLPVSRYSLMKADQVAVSGSDDPVANKAHNVLYIEDNHANIKLVEETFDTMKENHLLTAMTGKEGIEVAREKLPDLILLDIHLPDMNGLEVLERLRANDLTKNIPVLAISANAMQIDIEAALEAGFQDYLTKPIDIPHFLEVMSTYLHANK